MGMAREEEEAGIPEWVVTFGDMMSLLLTFFVLLFSMSEVKTEQSQALIESLRKRFGNDDSVAALIPGPAVPMNSAVARMASLGRARRLNTMNGGDKVKAPVGDYARVQAIRPADESTQGGVIYFAPASDELTPEDEKALIQTVAVIAGKPQKIEVRGHTSSRPLPPESPYRNRWDLAYARSSKVMEQLVRLGINPKRIRLSVAAANEPRQLGPNQKQQAQNARVEILMLDEFTNTLEGTAQQRDRMYSDDGVP